jgi:hypothetical protein
MLMGVTSWELGVLRVPLIMVPDTMELSFLTGSLPEEGSRDFSRRKTTLRYRGPSALAQKAPPGGIYIPIVWPQIGANTLFGYSGGDKWCDLARIVNRWSVQWIKPRFLLTISWSQLLRVYRLRISGNLRTTRCDEGKMKGKCVIGSFLVCFGD